MVRCIIVDDNEPFLEAAADLLRREGVDIVATAANSADAVRLVTELRPDVMLVDVDLGNEDGFELAQRLSDMPAASSRVILVSAHAEEDLAHLIARSPAIGFVSKARL
jgi:CheY-like chemotaxis protein